MQKTYDLAHQVARWGAYGGCAMLFCAAILVTIEVFIRKMFAMSMASADELGGYALGIAMAWGYSYCLFHRGHIRVDVLYVRLPLLARSILDVVSLLGFAAMMGMLTLQASNVLQETIRLSARSSTPLGTPLVVPQSLWFAGLLFFFLCICLLLVRSAWALLRGNLGLVQQIAGAPSMQEEVEEELHDLAQRRPNAGGAA
jgi:TRAP-type C4-dicarboxylate transport system permease small subunit